MGTMPCAAPQSTDWFGQPRGLTVLFLTEAWEKFSFFGMRTILVYYMTRQLLIGQEHASLIYGLYTAAVYFTPLVGGVIADRWLGRRKAVVIGGSIMATGHFMMASEPLFYAALATIAVGNGLFLPSLPSQINSLYGADDPRRRPAYNIYYVGVNLGGLLSVLVCGSLGELYGWHFGFTAAGIGMLLGLVIYVAGGRYLPIEPKRIASVESAAKAAVLREGVIQRFALLAAIAAVVVVYRAGYEQMGNTVALWAAGVDRQAGSFLIPMTWFQSLNPLFVLLLTPLLVARWTRQAKRGNESSSLAKMAIGAAVASASYWILAAVAAWSSANGVPAHWLCLAAFFIIITAGELFILPVGLGLFGRLAPPGMSATTIAAWFFAAFAGNLLAGMLGTFWSALSSAQFFALTGAVVGLPAILLLLLDRSTRRAEDRAAMVVAEARE